MTSALLVLCMLAADPFCTPDVAPDVAPDVRFEQPVEITSSVPAGDRDVAAPVVKPSENEGSSEASACANGQCRLVAISRGGTVSDDSENSTGRAARRGLFRPRFRRAGRR